MTVRRRALLPTLRNLQRYSRAIGGVLITVPSTFTRICAICWLSVTGAFGQKEVVKSLENTLPTGWECLQGPNELDRPGRVFYIDRKGVRFELADLSDQVRPETGELSNVVTGVNGSISAGLLAKILNLGGLSIKGSRTYSASVTLSQRREIRTQEAYIRAALRTLDPKLMDDRNSYYIIRNTQVAKQIRLVVDKAIAAAFGGEAQLNKSLTISGAATTPAPTPPKNEGGGTGTASQSKEKTAKATDGGASAPAPATTPAKESASANPPASSSPPTIFAIQDNRTYAIDQTFEKPLTVCFLAQKFTLKNIGGGVGGSIRDVQLIPNEFWNPAGKK